MYRQWKTDDVNRKLMDFIDRSPCSFYAVANLKGELLKRGFQELKEANRWELSPGGKYFVSRNSSSLLSFALPGGGVERFHVIASHSDSPSFKLKPGPALRSGCGILRAAVEQYGGPIDSTWFDRPLSVSGRVLVREEGESEREAGASGEVAGAGMNEAGACSRLREVLVFPEDLTLLLPSVAPHLLRKEQGSETISQTGRMFPLLGSGENGSLLWERLAEELGVRPEQILGADLYLCNREQARLWGAGKEFLSAPRLDDLACCYGSFLGFLESAAAPADFGIVPVHCVFDNEEVGSRTLQGADSGFLRDTLERICLCAGLSREEYHRAVAKSFLVSADNAHAVHPNYEQLSDPENRPALNGGIVVKHQAAQRYATDAVSAALFRQICRRHGIPVQEFTNRPGSTGGSTLGNLSVSQIPLRTVDVGLPQLAMHSCYETMGAEDTAALAAFSEAFYREPLPEVCEG